MDCLKLKFLSTTATLQKVALTGSRRRGGLLGQMSVLTASANGVDTSPVVRGIWILENLLGTPPSPPPPDVEVPEPDTRGDLTIRQLYAKHRTIPSCNDCHKKIDPLGLAFENFDAIGRWRTKDAAGGEIDSAGKLPDGKAFSSPKELKELVAAREAHVARNLTERLMAYALGRQLEGYDEIVVDRLMQRIAKDGYRLKTIVNEVVSSYLFTHRRVKG